MAPTSSNPWDQTDPVSAQQSSASGPDETTVQVTGLRVRLGRGQRARAAVDGLDLRASTGVLGLLGPNGAGKTTLVRTLATVLAPTEGQVHLLGLDVDQEKQRREVRRRLGYLPQDFGIYPRFTVREFVAYFAWLKEVPAARTPAAVELALERVGLSDRADARMRTLSGGMVRRAGLAQALVNEPELLLLDEPTAGLDPEQRVLFRRLIRELAVDTTVLLSTHLVEDVAGACDRVTVMESGRVALHATPAELASLGGTDDHAPEGEVGTSPIERGYTAALQAHRGALS